MHISNLKIFSNVFYKNNDKKEPFINEYNNNIICFNDRDSYNKYIGKYKKKRIGSGSEGIAYTTTDEDIVYKEYGNVPYYFVQKLYKKPFNIVLSREIDLPNKTFYLPIDLFYIDNPRKDIHNARYKESHKTEIVPYDVLVDNSVSEFLGYTSKRFKGDKLCDKDNPPDTIDFSNIKEAYDKLVEDALVLASCSIGLPDITYNLLYNEKEFGVIDTIDYFNNEMKIEVLKKSFDNDYAKTNITLINEAIGEEIAYYTGDLEYRKHCSDIDEIVSFIKEKNNGSLIVHRGKPIIKKK